MKGGRISKSNDGQNMSADDCELRNIEEKSSHSSDEYENSKEPEMSLQSQHTDGIDESDDVEHDVKVCDTCGDAGREYLLATCSRCIDGAQHIYCMKKPVDQVPKGNWLCEECKLEDVKNTNRVSGKRRAEELASYSSFKKQALDVDRGKVKPINQVSSDSCFGDESAEGSCSPATRPQLQSLRGVFSKSSSFSFSNGRSKTKLVDEIVLQRQKSTREHTFHDTTTVKEISKPMSFRSTNSGSFGPSGSKVKMLSPKSPHLQDLRSPKSNKERTFKKTNSVKLLSSRGETNSISSGSNAEVKPVKGDGKIISGLKSTNRLVSLSAEAAVSLGQSNKQLPSSPTRVSSVSSVDQKSVDISSKVAISKESINLADGITTGNNVSGLKTSKDVKNRENKLKDAIEAALLKKPGIYRKNKVPDQPAADESTMNNEQLPSSPTRASSSVNYVDQKLVDVSSKVPISKESTNLANGITTDNNVSGLKTSKDVKNRDNKLKDAIEAALLKKPGIYRKNKVADQPAADELTMNNEQLPSSPTRVSSSVNFVDQKSVDISSKVSISKESTNLADGITTGNNVSGLKTSKDVKNGDNKLKDAIEAALLKKPGIYRKNEVPDQSVADESTINNNNNEPHLRNTGTLTSADTSSSDWHPKQSNGNSSEQSIIILPSEVKPLTAGHDDVALSSYLKHTPIPDHECIWQGSFEINRSGKTAEFWDGLQAHLSSCASPRIYETVNKLPHKILLNGVSRVSAWPTQFENNGVKENNIGIYFFAKDIESYEKSYQVLLEDMMRGDLALIGSINGVELLIFPSNRLPEKSNRWNMLFFLWGVFRGKKTNLSRQIPNDQQKNCFVSSISTDKISLAENGGPFGAVEKDKHVDLESKVNSNMQNSSHEKGVDSISRPIDNVNVVPVNGKEIISEREPIKRPFIDLDVNATSQTDTWHDASGQQEGNFSKKKKSDNGERPYEKPVFPLDLNEDISCAVG
ncbi:protein PARALOG OF AIPP2-like [Bidens hawaiensis]|uniref:protein PARALOG OF AIPP2-like n=1 Tax=Bidens hawaiensis TaxID=980011 RepID=UPI004049ADF0